MDFHSNPAGESAAQTEIAGMIAVLSHIDAAGFHGIESSPIGDSAWSGQVRNAWIAAAAIEWPEPLQPLVKAFTDATSALTAALHRGDVVAASTPAREAHAAQHRLSNAGWGHLAQAVGIQGEDDIHSPQHLAP